ncbi:single-strand DNA-binding protein [Nonomuraea thailandensis]|uniref:Single-stranded DNA-binding protein n=1 Tax=Nonomuraea thailandensis TaxID=1188745 RepID=A0A9X2GED9_9ACTN|nr:single-stranded DNA-binding protein [Nonomuraea thailandensis]MCP2353163.1 single-strand DNA-binding protein [Nonomuraea thailandensis]
MANDIVITLTGNLTDDPELRFTPTGDAVARFRVASSPRYLDRQSSQWKDGRPLYMTCSVWRQQAEHVAESLQRGMRVIVEGRLKQRTYDTAEGDKRTVYELEVIEVGPSLRNATARVTPAKNGRTPAPAPTEDPWAGAFTERPDTEPALAATASGDGSSTDAEPHL